MCSCICCISLCMDRYIYTDTLLLAHENKNLASVLWRSYSCRHPCMTESSRLCRSRCKDLDHSQHMQPMVPLRHHWISFLLRQEFLELSESLAFCIHPTQEEWDDRIGLKFRKWPLLTRFKEKIPKKSTKSSSRIDSVEILELNETHTLR